MNTLGGQSTKERRVQDSLGTGKEGAAGAQRLSWDWPWYQRGFEMFSEGWGQGWNTAKLWKRALAKTDGDARTAKRVLEGWRKGWDWELEAQFRQHQAD